MAKVRITREEIERGLLPKVCALTGEPTDDTKRHGFLWQPAWVGVLFLAGLLPYVIVSLVLRKTMTVDVPLVREKHGHWLWRVLVGWGGILFFLALLVAGLVVGGRSDRFDGGGGGVGGVQATVGGVMFAVGIIGFLAALITAVVLNNYAIRAAEITDRSITLLGVHRHFRDALEDDRDREEEKYRKERDEDRRRRDDRPRKARPVDDDDRDD